MAESSNKNARIWMAAVASLIMSTTQTDLSYWDIDYDDYKGQIQEYGVLIPPDKYLHAPDDSDTVVIEEKTAAEIRSACADVDDACVMDTQKRAALHKKTVKFCVVNGAPAKCKTDDLVAGDVISENKIVLIPKVGERFGDVPVTDDMQQALLVHEIGHLNGWPADHPRH